MSIGRDSLRGMRRVEKSDEKENDNGDDYRSPTHRACSLRIDWAKFCAGCHLVHDLSDLFSGFSSIRQDGHSQRTNGWLSL